MALSILQGEEPTLSRPESRSDATEQERRFLKVKGRAERKKKKLDKG
jgi:hypothetical protein